MTGEETNKKRKAAYEPEPIRPEWLELPPELAEIDFETDDASWNKYAPYNDTPIAAVPEDTPPVFSKESPALCFHVNATCGRARACSAPCGGATP